MNQESNPILSGFTRLGVIGCVCLSVLVFSGIFAPQGLTTHSDPIIFMLDHAGDLRVGSQITFRGIVVGSIESIDLVRFDGSNIAQAQSAQKDPLSPRIKATGSVQNRIRSFVTDDSTLTIRENKQQVTSIDIQPGNGTPISTGGVLNITQEPSLDLETEQVLATKSLRNAAESITNLSQLISGEDGLDNTLRTLGDAGHSVRDTAEEMRILIRDGRSPLLTSLQQLEDILIDLRAYSQSMPEMMDSIARAGKQGEQTLFNIEQLLHENRAPFRATLENLQYTSENFHALAAELRRRPWRILNAPGDRESAFIALHDSANRYAEGALEVRRATEQVRDLLDRRGEDRSIINKLDQAMQVLADRLTRQEDLEASLLKRTLDLASPR